MTRRTNARIAGSAFLLYIAVGVAMMVIGAGTRRGADLPAQLASMASHAVRVRTNAVLGLAICAVALSLAISLYAITRDEDRDLAALALAFRLGEGLIGVTGPATTLALLSLATSGPPRAPDVAAVSTLAAFLFAAGNYQSLVTATLFAVGSTIFCWLLLRGRMIPAPLAWTGVAASVLLVVVLPLQLVGVVSGTPTQLVWLPMALFEIPTGIWMLVRGVRDPRPRQSLDSELSQRVPPYPSKSANTSTARGSPV